MNQMQQMFAQAKRMERELKNARAALAEKEFVIKKAGIIEVTLKGNMTVQSIKIEADALEADNKEMIEDTLAMAVNEGLAQIQAEADAIEQRITGQSGLGF